MAEKNISQSIPGQAGRGLRFAEVQHAENAGKTLRRIATYFAKEKAMVLGMLTVVILGTLCSICATLLLSCFRGC